MELPPEATGNRPQFPADQEPTWTTEGTEVAVDPVLYFFLNMNLLYLRYVNNILKSNHQVLRLSSMPLSRAQRLRLEAAHEDCRDDLVLVGLSLSVQISKLQGAANAEVGQTFGAMTFLDIISFNVRSICFSFLPVCPGKVQADQNEE